MDAYRAALADQQQRELDDPERYYDGLDLYAICEPATGGCGHMQGVHEFGVGLDEQARCLEDDCDCRDMR